MTPTADDVMQVFSNGESVPGITVYGLFTRGGEPAPPSFPAEIWPVPVQVDHRLLHNAAWAVIAWDVAIEAWPEPEAWADVLMGTFEAVLAYGAGVTWCGVEGIFADPPHLFEWRYMQGGVYAAMSNSTGFVCRTQPGGKFDPLNESEMEALRNVAASTWEPN